MQGTPTFKVQAAKVKSYGCLRLDAGCFFFRDSFVGINNFNFTNSANKSGFSSTDATCNDYQPRSVMDTSPLPSKRWAAATIRPSRNQM